jgi:tricorn protease
MAASAADAMDFGDVIRLLMGHLNASHIGYSPSAGGGAGSRSEGAEAGPTGFLGIIWDEAYTGPGMKVARVIAGSPSSKAGQKVGVGDVVTAINGTEIDKTSDIDTLLEDMVGEKVTLAVRGADGTSMPRTVTAGSYTSVSALLYDEMIENRKNRVHELSGGKLAYLHIKGMDGVSQDKFEQGLYAEGYGKQALLIDVRDNGGGSTADYLLTMLHQPRHAYTIGRNGKPGYPIDRLPFYPWLKPAALLTNQNAYSNAEIFSHAFKQLGRGPVIGTPTFGAVISTGAASLLDGSTVRMPLRGWYRITDGVNEEHTGAEVDVRVDLTVQDEVRGLDPQLEAGVKALLEGPKAKAVPPAKRPRYERKGK